MRGGSPYSRDAAARPDLRSVGAVSLVAGALTQPSPRSGVESKGKFIAAESADWLAGQLGCEVIRVPGYHVPYWHPGQSKPFAEALRPSLRTLAS